MTASGFSKSGGIQANFIVKGITGGFGGSTLDVTIPEVDLNKAVIFNYGSTNSQTSSHRALRRTVSARFVNSTTVRFERFQDTSSIDSVSYAVFEFDGLKRLQAGYSTFSSNQGTVTIDEIDIGNSLLIFSSAGREGNANDNRAFVNRADILDSTTIRFINDGTSGSSHAHGWFILEF